MTGRRVLICGGGTGGHLFPALVLGQALREKDPTLDITYIGGDRPAERDLMSRSGARFIALRIEGIKGRGLKSIRALTLLPGAFMKSRAIIARSRPSLVVGVGSYSSGPLVLLASLRGIPTLLLEQNVRPGYTNRLLLGRVRRVAAAFEASLPFLKGKGVFLGNPVRKEFRDLPRKRHNGALDLLVFGGSQGSRFLNTAVAGALPELGPVRGRVRIVHQTGAADLDAIRRAYRDHGWSGAVIEPFFDDMPARLAAADLAVCRAGATTCAELIAARKAAILVPFAGAADDHQRVNAEALAEAGGAVVIPEPDWTPGNFVRVLRELQAEPGRITAMENALAALDPGDAAPRIADLCFELMGERA